MKKFISFALAMVLCLTSVCAFAAGSPTPETFLIDTSKTEFKTDGITTDGKTDKSTELTNKVTTGRKATTNIGDISIGKPISFVDDKGDSVENSDKGKSMTNFAIVPFPQYSVGDNVTEELGKFIIPLSRPVSEYLMDNLDKMNIFFMYEKDEAINSYKIPEWYIVATGKATYGLLGMISTNILRDAQDCPTCLDFELIEK